MRLDYINQLFNDDDNEEFHDIFKDFNFELLDNSEFQEDAVREELIFPLLKSLGYTASGENKIIRSKKLKHPFYYFGTTKYDVNIIPDYTFQIEEKNKWILDAKRPTENIFEGKNVFQAYSYAMHPEIQSDIYCLCNGKEFVIFDIKSPKPLLSFNLKDLKNNWKKLNDYLSPELVIKPHIRDFHYDFGLFLFRIGDIESKIAPIDFQIQKLNYISKLDDNTYCINQVFEMKGFEGKTFMGTFDFDKKLYHELLNILPQNFRDTIQNRLKNQPFRYMAEEVPEINITMRAMIGEQIFTNQNESYLPFNVIKFLKC